MLRHGEPHTSKRRGAGSNSAGIRGSVLGEILSTSAFLLWTIYGAYLGELPIVVPNAICFFLAGFILIMKVLPRPKREAIADAIAPSEEPGT